MESLPSIWKKNTQRYMRIRPGNQAKVSMRADTGKSVTQMHTRINLKDNDIIYEDTVFTRRYSFIFLFSPLMSIDTVLHEYIAEC